MNIADKLRENRPTLTASSLKTYVSTLRNLYKKVFPEDDNINIDKFEDCDKILQHLRDLPPNKRKSILAPLVVLTDRKKYKDLMNQDAETYNKEQAENKKTKKQEENWVTQAQIREIFQHYEAEATRLYKMDGDLTMAQIQSIQNYIILCLVSGIYIPPRRSMDWVVMKVKDFDANKDNFYDGRRFVFNRYKTAKYYHQQDIAVPLILKRILNKWVKNTRQEWLLFDANQNPLTPIKLTQRLNRIFGDRKVSVNILRHSYLTEKYGNMPSLANMQQEAEEMGHSVLQALEYVKK